MLELSGRGLSGQFTTYCMGGNNKIVMGVYIMDKKELLRQLIVAEREKPTTRINQPEDIVPMLMKYARKKEEHFYAVCLNGQHEIIAVKHITKGLVNRTLVHAREVFREAVRKNACAVIVAHNHPSGSSRYSREDADVTKRLKDAGEILGIPLLDHVIVSTGGYYSFLEDRKL